MEGVSVGVDAETAGGAVRRAVQGTSAALLAGIVGTRHEQIESPADSSRPAIDFAAVRAAITIAQVLMLLGFVPRSDNAGPDGGEVDGGA